MSSSSDSDDDDFSSQRVIKDTSSEAKKGSGKGEGRLRLAEGKAFSLFFTASRKKRVRRLQPIPLDNDGTVLHMIEITNRYKILLLYLSQVILYCLFKLEA